MAGAFVAAFFLAGFSETLTVLLLISTSALALNHHNKRTVIACLAGALAGMAIVYVAPGTAIRGALLGARQPVAAALMSAARNTLIYGVHQAATSPFVYLTVLIVGYMAARSSGQRMRRRMLLIIALVGLALVGATALVFPSTWVLGGVDPRGYTAVQAYWIVLTVAIGWVAGCSRKAYSQPS